MVEARGQKGEQVIGGYVPIADGTVSATRPTSSLAPSTLSSRSWTSSSGVRSTGRALRANWSRTRVCRMSSRFSCTCDVAYYPLHAQFAGNQGLYRGQNANACMVLPPACLGLQCIRGEKNTGFCRTAREPHLDSHVRNQDVYFAKLPKSSNVDIAQLGERTTEDPSASLLNVVGG